MAGQNAKYIWMSGKLVPWDQANIHITAHVAHYGSNVFEGMRAYATEGGPAVWCMMPHVERMFNSAKIYRMPIPWTREQVAEAIEATVSANEHPACYIRPLLFRGCGALGVDPAACSVELAIITLNWGRYLGADAIEKGIDVCVSSWRRAAPDTFPTMAKAGGNYINSQLMKMEALMDGYAEAIALDSFGFVSEGSGENLFLVRNGTLVTPPLSAGVLPGVTRGCVLTLAGDLGIPVREENVPREGLYLADEAFFTGTAAEISPIKSVDRIPVGKGTRGPITHRLQDEFFALTEGRAADRHAWLWPVKKMAEL